MPTNLNLRNVNRSAPQGPMEPADAAMTLRAYLQWQERLRAKPCAHKPELCSALRMHRAMAAAIVALDSYQTRKPM